MSDASVATRDDAGANACTSGGPQLSDQHWDWINQFCRPDGGSSGDAGQSCSSQAPPAASNGAGDAGATVPQPAPAEPTAPAAAPDSGSHVLDHVLGGVKMIGGALETAAGAGLVLAGAATSEIGVGIPLMAAGAFVTAHGADVTVSGARTMVSGEQTDTLTSQGLQAAGMTRTEANLTDAGISVVGTLGAGAATRAPTVAAAVAGAGEETAVAAPAAADAAAGAAPAATDAAAGATPAATDAAAGAGQNSVSLAFKPGLPTGHNMVGVTADGTTQWSHLVVDGVDQVSGGASRVAASGTGASVVSASGPSSAYVTATVPVSAEGAQAARAAMQGAVDQGAAGAYSYASNNCTTYATSILREAGVAAPSTTPAGALVSTALQSPAVMQPVAAAGTAAACVDGVASVANPAPVSQSGENPDAGVCVAPPDPASSSAAPAP